MYGVLCLPLRQTHGRRDGHSLGGDQSNLVQTEGTYPVGTFIISACLLCLLCVCGVWVLLVRLLLLNVITAITDIANIIIITIIIIIMIITISLTSTRTLSAERAVLLVGYVL